jgi:hypothetical protein
VVVVVVVLSACVGRREAYMCAFKCDVTHLFGCRIEAGNQKRKYGILTAIHMLKRE